MERKMLELLPVFAKLIAIVGSVLGALAWLLRLDNRVGNNSKDIMALAQRDTVTACHCEEVRDHCMDIINQRFKHDEEIIAEVKDTLNCIKKN